MIGTYYRLHTGSADELTVTDQDIDAYLNALNTCLPDVTIRREDIVAVHAGILPLSAATRTGSRTGPT
jgi:glycerol-3-phosphate dehydrogenase